MREEIKNEKETEQEERCEELDTVLHEEDDVKFEKLAEELEKKCKDCKNPVCECNGQAQEFMNALGITEDDIVGYLEEKEESKKEEEDPEVLAKRAKKVSIPKTLKDSVIIAKARERAIATAVSIKVFLEEGLDYESAVGLGNNIIQSLLQEELGKIQIINNRKNNEI